MLRDGRAQAEDDAAEKSRGHRDGRELHRARLKRIRVSM